MRTLVIGADPFPPYQYIDEDGEIYGSDYKVIKSIIDMMGYKAKFIIDEWSLIEKMFHDKEIDIVFQVQKTPEREKSYYFSEKLRDATTLIVTSTNNIDCSNINELFKDNLKLGVIENYKYGEIIDSIELENKAFFKSLDDLLKSVDDKITGFGVVDLGVYEYLNKDNIYNNVKILNNFNFNRPLYVAFNDELLREEFSNHFHDFKRQ